MSPELRGADASTIDAMSDADMAHCIGSIKIIDSTAIAATKLDDVLVDKDHPWASRKPSKRALQVAFYQGRVTISARTHDRNSTNRPTGGRKH